MTDNQSAFERASTGLDQLEDAFGRTMSILSDAILFARAELEVLEIERKEWEQKCETLRDDLVSEQHAHAETWETVKLLRDRLARRGE